MKPAVAPSALKVQAVLGERFEVLRHVIPDPAELADDHTRLVSGRGSDAAIPALLQRLEKDSGGTASLDADIPMDGVSRARCDFR